MLDHSGFRNVMVEGNLYHIHVY